MNELKLDELECKTCKAHEDYKAMVSIGIDNSLAFHLVFEKTLEEVADKVYDEGFSDGYKDGQKDGANTGHGLGYTEAVGDIREIICSYEDSLKNEG